jgi:hypothetical protein
LTRRLSPAWVTGQHHLVIDEMLPCASKQGGIAALVYHFIKIFQEIARFP